MSKEIAKEILEHQSLGKFPIVIKENYEKELQSLKELEIITYEPKQQDVDDEISEGFFNKVLPNTIFLNDDALNEYETLAHEFIHVLQNIIFKEAKVGQKEYEIIAGVCGRYGAIS